MRTFTMAVSLLAAVAFAGCKKKDEPAPTVMDPAAAAATDASAAAAAPPAGGGDTHGSGGGGGTGGGGGMGAGAGGGGSLGGTGTMASKMANCPSAVPGATTTVAEAKDAVEVTVVARDKKGSEDIRARAKKLAEAAKAPEPAEIKHSGMGTGGGEIGHCPVVLDDTTVEIAEVEGGVKLTVKPSKAENLAALAAESKRRNENLPRTGEAPPPGK